MSVSKSVDEAGTSGTPLTIVEKVALSLGRFMNERPGPKAAQDWYQRNIANKWVSEVLSNVLHVDGLEKVKHLTPERGVLLCSNHRSFFDQYVVTSILVREAPWVKRIYFPVRSNFFYEGLPGMLVNAFIAGYVMYPPIFRDTTRSVLNKVAMDKVADFLDTPGSLVGIHPEGTRGKGPDPYEMLRAQPGVGQVALRSRPTILPVFINGISNDLGAQIIGNYRRGEKRAQPVIVVFGDPVDLGELLEQKPRAALYKRAADRIRDRIQDLMPRERELRAQLDADRAKAR